MILLLIVTNIFLGTDVTALNAHTVEALKNRGLSTARVDLSKAIDVAFATRDKALFKAIGESLEYSDIGGRFADQVMSLYELQPEDDFKESIAFTVAFSLQNVDRVMQSRWGCDFYRRALGVLYGHSPVLERGRATILLDTLSSECGVMLPPYLVKAVLVLPDDENDYLGIYIVQLDNNRKSITPAMAYHMLQRVKDVPRAALNEDLFGPLRELAAPLLRVKELPTGSSRKEVLAQLDALIEADGKKLCEKYGKIQYQPLPPPSPSDSND